MRNAQNQPFYRQMHNRCLFTDASGALSCSFMEIASRQPALTFDERFLNPLFRPRWETPFKEIRRLPPDPPRGACGRPLSAAASRPLEMSAYIPAIVEAVKAALRPLSGKKVLFSCSSGSDTRIIAGCLAQIRAEGANLDGMVFLHWGRPELASFHALMRRFDFTRIHVVDDFRENPYGIGDPGRCVDGFHPYTSQMRFWGDLDPAEYILLSGATGITMALPWHLWQTTPDFFCERGEAEHRLAKIFKDVCFPNLHPGVLAAAMAVPPELKNIPDSRIKRDKLRTEICDYVGALEGIPAEPSFYNFNFTREHKLAMLDLYGKSRFHQDTKAALDAAKLFDRPTGFDSRLWAFGVTVYDKLMS